MQVKWDKMCIYRITFKKKEEEEEAEEDGYSIEKDWSAGPLWCACCTAECGILVDGRHRRMDGHQSACYLMAVHPPKTDIHECTALRGTTRAPRRILEERINPF